MGALVDRPEEPAPCRCEHCDEPAELDGRCDFCWLHCPRGAHGFAGAFQGLHRWRAHVLKGGLEEEGHDVLLMFPLVVALGSLARAERWAEELRALDAMFALRCNAED